MGKSPLDRRLRHAPGGKAELIRGRVGRSFHAYNIGLLSSRASAPLFSPCTPAGVMLLLESTKTDIAGKHAVVLGRSDIVGSPLCALLRRKDATVTQCHSKTTNLESFVSHC